LIFIKKSLIIMIIFALGMNIGKTTVDILKGINATIWGGVEGAEKVGKIVKTGVSGADVVIGTSHALEDYACKDYVCTTIDIIGSASTAVGMVLGNIPATKHLTTVTGSITVGCRTIRYYCKRYGTFWGCTVAAGEGLKKAIKFTVNQN
jgi:hypothetical protein